MLAACGRAGDAPAPVSAAASPPVAAPAETPPPRPAPPAAPETVHLLQPGDTLWKLAERYYGDGSRWQEIADANRGSGPFLAVGGELVIPGVPTPAGGTGPTPDDIVRRIHGRGYPDVVGLWRELGVTSKLFVGAEAWGNLPFQAERIDLKDPRATGLVSLARITDRENRDWQYLVFRGENGNRTFAGHIDVPMQKYDPPRHRLETAGDAATYLVLQTLDGSGAGFVLCLETWHALEVPGLRQVLSFPQKGHVSQPGMACRRVFSGRATKVTADGGESAVRVLLHVRYFNDLADALPDLGELFSLSWDVWYVRKPGAPRFVLDPARSGLTEADVTGLWEDGPDEFLARRVRELEALAASSDPLRREWVRRFLATCKDGPAKAALAQRVR